MIRSAESVVINRPTEEVFAFLTDIEKHPQWSAELVETKKTSEGPVGVGTTYIGVVKVLGQRMEMNHEVTECEPNSKFGVKVTSGPVSGGGGFTFEPVEGGTKATFIGQAEVGGFFRLAERVVGRTMRRQWETNLGNLKDLLEAQA